VLLSLVGTLHHGLAISVGYLAMTLFDRGTYCRGALWLVVRTYVQFCNWIVRAVFGLVANVFFILVHWLVLIWMDDL
jgi:hypothetical protein